MEGSRILDGTALKVGYQRHFQSYKKSPSPPREKEKGLGMIFNGEKIGKIKGGDMMKTKGVLLAAFLLSVSFCAPGVFAQAGSGGDLEAKLKDVQARKEQVAKEYRAAVDQVNSEADGKIRQIKADYRKACKECANDKDAKCKKLSEDYDTKMQPLKAEEDQIRSTMAPSQRMNFAQPKYERREK